MVFAAALLLAPPVSISAEQDAAAAQPSRDAAAFELTVDSIMRGPDLVGYPPSGLRWSADSQKLYFDWRKPGEEEASTYVVGRDGGAPRKLSDDETKNIPPAAGGRWDEARRRVLFVDGGDIVMVDASQTRAARLRGRPAASRTRAGRARTRTSPTSATATSSSSRSTPERRRSSRS